MRRTTQLTLLCGLAFVLSASDQNCDCPDNCPKRCPKYPGDGWVQFRESCYLFNDKITVLQYISGHACFISMADNLEINDKEEDDFIRSFASRLFKYPTNLNASFWTGAYYSENKNIWSWSSENKNMTYTNWYPNQPRKPVPHSEPAPPQHCLALVGAHNFTWHDVPCHEYHHYICEISLNSPKAHFIG